MAPNTIFAAARQDKLYWCRDESFENVPPQLGFKCCGTTGSVGFLIGAIVGLIVGAGDPKINFTGAERI